MRPHGELPGRGQNSILGMTGVWCFPGSNLWTRGCGRWRSYLPPADGPILATPPHGLARTFSEPHPSDSPVSFRCLSLEQLFCFVGTREMPCVPTWSLLPGLGPQGRSCLGDSLPDWLGLRVTFLRSSSPWCELVSAAPFPSPCYCRCGWEPRFVVACSWES